MPRLKNEKLWNDDYKGDGDVNLAIIIIKTKDKENEPD